MSNGSGSPISINLMNTLLGSGSPISYDGKYGKSDIILPCSATPGVCPSADKKSLVHDKATTTFLSAKAPEKI